MISVNEALQRLLSSFHPVQSESILLSESAGRVLYEGVKSEIDLPLFTNSSMDGFAVRSIDVSKVSKNHPVTLSIVEDIPAGKIPSIHLEENQSSRIMTGAPIPSGADAVIPVEDTDQYDLKSRSSYDLPPAITVYRAVGPGDYIRHKGEDVKKNEVVLHANSPLKPQELGILAMLGKAQISVYRRPKIIILSTGDELVPVEVPLQSGQIHDSNAYTLSALIERDFGDPEYLGIVSDNEDSVREFLITAVAKSADLILSSAGVSVGVFDFVRTVVQSDGNLNFWRVNMRPGKPIAFGDFQGVPFIGLPGNPVAAFVGYEVFVRPAILKLSGIQDVPRYRIKAKLIEDIESDGRESYLRGIIHLKNDEWIARLTGHQGSGNLLSLVQANALLIIPSGVKSLAAGAEVDAWLLD
ncbi:MAG TPA: gephyrin-like molybdotransferase Glp [Anaerolineales bacterium]|nr:gephyrin-like molybdotransferase Glp [Anaerolineales bacterium]